MPSRKLKLSLSHFAQVYCSKRTKKTTQTTREVSPRSYVLEKTFEMVQTRNLYTGKSACMRLLLRTFHVLKSLFYMALQIHQQNHLSSQRLIGGSRELLLWCFCFMPPTALMRTERNMRVKATSRGSVKGCDADINTITSKSPHHVPFTIFILIRVCILKEFPSSSKSVTDREWYD